MHNSFKSNIQTHGAKHGSLISLQDNGFGDKVLPFHLLKPGEALTTQQRQDFSKWEDTYGTNKLIVRSSHPGDWEGLVDVMPTYQKRTREDVEQTLERMSEELGNKKLKQYATNEGTDFKVSDCSISIAPYKVTDLHGFGNKFSTITEHPNAYDIKHFMIDTGSNGGFNCMDYNDIDLPTEIRKLMEEISEKVVGDDSIVLQLETSAVQEGNLDHLYQIRQFAKRNPLPLYKDQLKTKPSEEIFERFFGTTATRYSDDDIAYFKEKGIWNNREKEMDFYDPRSGMLKTVGLNRGDKIGERRTIPDYTTLEGEREYILYQSDLSERKTSIDYHQPQGMKVYLGGSSSPALSHMHTRYIKMILEKEGGAAYLAQRGDIRYKILYIMNDKGATGLDAMIIPGQEASGMYSGWI